MPLRKTVRKWVTPTVNLGTNLPNFMNHGIQSFSHFRVA